MFRALQENELRLLCLDFDRTILRVHTSGCYEGPPEALVQQVRREFADLIQVALAAGTSVAVVTFSPQAALIRGLLHSVMPAVWIFMGSTKVSATFGVQCAKRTSRKTLRIHSNIPKAFLTAVVSEAKVLPVTTPIL